MTLNTERFRAINKARDLLRDLLDRSKTPRVPLAIRKEAYWVLKHFPWKMDIERIAECKKCSKIISKEDK